MHSLRIFLLFLTAALAAPAAFCEEFAWYDGRWAQEASDLAPEAKVRFYRLKNGFRYAVIPNQNPKGRVSLYLDVQAGSLMEEPGERGFAHFIEHMAFNGTKHFPEGSLIPFFQENAMGFGSDTNAHTTLHETVYKLNLASNTPENIEKGLTVLRDFADGICFSESAIEREKGVILAEKMSRENEQVLSGRKYREFLFEGSRLAGDAIGAEETVRGACARSLKAFYDRWYVPSRMILVAAGDADPDEISSLIEKAFSSMAPKAAPVLETFGGSLPSAPRAFVQKRSISSVTVSVNFQYPRVKLMDSFERLGETYMDAILQDAANRRLAALREREPSVTLARARVSWRDGLSPSVMFTASSDPQSWEKALKGLHAEIASLRAYGISPQELSQGKTDLERRLKHGIRQISAWTNEDWAKAFVANANMNRVFTSPETDLEAYEKIKASITQESAAAVLAKILSTPSVTISVSGKTDASSHEILDLWSTLEKEKPEKNVWEEESAFPYLTLPKAAPAPELKKLSVPAPEAPLNASEAVLSSGVRVIFLPLKGDRGTARATLIYGSGLQGQTDAGAAVAKFAYRVLAENGAGKLSRRQSGLILGSRGVKLTENLGERSGFIAGEAPSGRLKLMLEAIWTQFMDPTLTEANRRRVISALKEGAFTREETVDGRAKYEPWRFFYGGRLRDAPLSADAAETISLTALRAYMDSTRKAGPATLVISGDFELETASKESARLFSDLPVTLKASFRGTAPRFPAGETKAIALPKEKVDKALAERAWHLDLPDPSDRKTLALRGLAASIMRDRLRETLREELGIAYSPSALYRAKLDDAGFAMLIVRTQTQTENIAKTLEVYDRLARDLASGPLTEKELERIRKPLLTGIATSFTSDRVTHSRLCQAVSSGTPLISWTLAYKDALEKASSEEVGAELKKLLSAPSATLVIKQSADPKK